MEVLACFITLKRDMCYHQHFEIQAQKDVDLNDLSGDLRSNSGNLTSLATKKGSPVLFPVETAGTIQLELAMRILEKGSKLVHLPDCVCGFHPKILLAMSSF